jgi:hypothetical protein
MRQSVAWVSCHRFVFFFEKLTRGSIDRTPKNSAENLLGAPSMFVRRQSCQHIYYYTSTVSFRESPIYTRELSQKSDFQLSTTKPDNIDHPTVETGQIWPNG